MHVVDVIYIYIYMYLYTHMYMYMRIRSVLGLNEKYKNTRQYKKFIAVPANRKIHEDYLAHVKTWIAEHKDKVTTSSRVHTWSAAYQDKYKSTLTVTRGQSTKFLAPKKQFVRKEDWCTEEDGDIEKATFVTQTILGEDVLGAYVLKGRKGHYDVEEADEKGWKQTSTEHEANDTVSMVGLQNKTKVQGFT